MGYSVKRERRKIEEKNRNGNCQTYTTQIYTEKLKKNEY